MKPPLAQYQANKRKEREQVQKKAQAEEEYKKAQESINDFILDLTLRKPDNRWFLLNPNVS